MKFIPKYITTDILAEYGEHLTHESYNEMVKLNSTQGDYNSQVLNQLFNTDEGIQIPYLNKKIKEVTDDQAAINEDMEQVVADMAALAGSLSKYSTILETRRMIQYATQDFVKTNKIKAGENVEVEVDALNNVIISATGGGDVTKEYVDEQDAVTLQSSKGYTDTKISQIPIPVVPTNISAFNNDVGYITGYTETDPIFSASAAAGITSQDITDWGNKSDFSGNYADLNGKPDLSVYVDKTSTQAISGSKLFTTIPQTNKQATENNHIINKKYFDDHIPVVPTNISAFNNDSGYITGYTETDPVFSASPAAGITAQDILDWSDKEIHILRDSDLDNGVFYLKGKKKGIYAFEHTVSVAYDDTHTVYETFHYGFFYLYMDIPTDDSVSGPVGCFLGYTDSDYNANGYNYLRWSTSPGSVMIYPTMPSTMSGCSFSWSYSSIQYMSPTKFYTEDLELHYYDSTATYNIGDWVAYDNAIYVCNTTISTPESFNSAHWTQQTAVDYLDTKYATSSTTWGSITGTLSNQTDLANALKLAPIPTIVDAHWTDAAREFIFADKPVGTYLVHNGSTGPQSDITSRTNMSFRASTATSSRVTVTAQWGIIYINKAYNDASTDEIFGYALFANGQTDGTMTYSLQSIKRLSSGYRISFNNMMVTNNNSPIKKMIRLYDSSSTYDVDDLVLNTDGWFYRCTTAITTPEAFNSAHWTNFEGYGIDKYIKELISQIPGGNLPLEAGSYTSSPGIQMISEPSFVANNASGLHSVALGTKASATDREAFAMGYNVTASGSGSFATGDSTQALGLYAFASGYNTIANERQFVHGYYNINKNYSNTGVVHIVGNGTGTNARSNAYTLDNQGNGWFAGDVYVDSTSGTDKDSGSVKLLRSDVIAPEYDATSTYALGAYVMYAGALYECTTAITQAEAWDSTHWTQRTIEYCLSNINGAPGVYSLSETQIGTWCNGRPLYRCVVPTGQISSQDKTVPHSINNFNILVNISGIAIESGICYTLPRVSNTNLNRQISLKCDATNVYIEAGSNANFTDSFVIIEYTKTI